MSDHDGTSAPGATQAPAQNIPNNVIKIDNAEGRKIHSHYEVTDSSGRVYSITKFFDKDGNITDGRGNYYDPDGSRERDPYARRQREARERRAHEAAEIAAIARESGLGYKSAELLHRYRKGSAYLTLAEHAFCEEAEKRLAADKVERALAARDGRDVNANRASPASVQPPAWPDDKPLPYVDLSLDLTPRQWLVHERIPMRNVSMLGGEGAIGKSLLLMQLSGAVVLGKDWIGTLPEMGGVLYVSCEEDAEEVNRRMEDVARHLGSTRQEMIDWGLCVLSFAGEDAVLAQPDRAGVMRPSPLFERIQRDAMEQRPKLIVFDTVADIFAGKEIDRAQTRQFITMLRGLAIEVEAAVIIAAHPSLEGIKTGSGLSGSTGWHNSVRARMYFHPAPGDDPALRVLETKKSNYSEPAENILLRWKDGVYRIEPRQGTLEQLAAEAKADQLFLTLLRRFTKQGRNVSDKTGTSYAPAQFAKQPEAKKAEATSKMLADAMERLFATGKIRVHTEGPRSHPRTRLVEASTDPSTDLPPPSTGVCVPSPYNPPPGGSGQGGGGRPAASTGQAEGESPRRSQPSPLASWEADALRARGFSPDDLLDMNPRRAREILADPTCDHLVARYGRGGHAPPETRCLVCDKPGARMFASRTAGADEIAARPKALHLECAPKWFEGPDLPMSE